jgi:hypothetical protein
MMVEKKGCNAGASRSLLEALLTVLAQRICNLQIAFFGKVMYISVNLG